MVDSSSIHDTSIRQTLLTIKPQQNLIIDLAPFIYDPYMLYVVECLKYSPLVDALSEVEIVPMSCLSHLYSTAYYDKAAERIHFEIHNEKTSISKHRFCALIGLSQEPTLVNPESISTGKLFSMFYQIGYTETLTTITKFKKSCFPPQWNALFTLLFKGLSERSADSDGASKSFMIVLYGLYHGIDLDYGSIIYQQLVQSLHSSSRHSEISCGRYWSIITKWAMDHLHVPIMVDYLLSSIANFHTTKIIVIDPTRYSFLGSIHNTKLACVSTTSTVLQKYRKLPSSVPRELTKSMVHSIEEADKPAKRGKRNETQNETRVTKPTKGQTHKKRKSDKAAPSQPQPRKLQKTARRLILQSSTDSESEYVPPKHKSAPPSESESESSDDEASGRGDTPPRSPTLESPVRSLPPSHPHVTIPLSIPLIFPIPTSQPSTTIPIPIPIFIDTTTTTTTTCAHSTAPTPPVTTEPPLTIEPPITTKPLSPTPSIGTTPVLGGEDLEFDSTYFSPYRVQSDEGDDEPITKRHLKATPPLPNAIKPLLQLRLPPRSAKKRPKKFEKLVSEANLFWDSLQAAAQKNTQTLNASVDNLQRSLQAERSKLESAHQAIEAANATMHDKVNDRLTELEAELAV
uniref:Uncharacterized protein n=1 Tax=Lactuca sativa TaxID=4236 RepID=A0A9R1V7L6_LACSA|nr:hypothetical protein LSAT_V11C600320930 [Lactuca sativa]